MGILWYIDVGISLYVEVPGGNLKFWYIDVGISFNVEVPGGNLKFIYFELITFHPDHINHTPPVRT